MFSLAIAAAMIFGTCFFASGAPFLPGSIVVSQVGADGSQTPLAGTGTATFLKEFSVTGTPIQSLALPTTASGSQLALTLSGSSTSEGFLTLSANGQYLTVGGYNALVGGTTSGTAGNRVAGRIDLLGNIDTSTNLQDSTGNIRSVVSSNGTDIWEGSSSGGVRYTTFGTAAASTQINSAAPTNTRVVNIFNNQLYMSSSSGTFLGVGTVGSGLPTSSGQTPALLTGFPTTGTHSSYDYFFKDANTLYVADDGNAASGGGIQKWIQSAGTWSLAYTLLNDGTANTPLRGLTGFVDALGNTVLYGVGGASLVTVTDTGVDNDVAVVLATAGTNTAFRGVELIPVPEPSTFLLGGAALLGLVGIARRRNAA